MVVAETHSPSWGSWTLFQHIAWPVQRLPAYRRWKGSFIVGVVAHGTCVKKEVTGEYSILWNRLARVSRHVNAGTRRAGARRMCLWPSFGKNALGLPARNEIHKPFSSGRSRKDNRILCIIYPYPGTEAKAEKQPGHGTSMLKLRHIGDEPVTLSTRIYLIGVDG